MTYDASNPSMVWKKLHNERINFLYKCERYAALTIPGVCLPAGVNEKTSELTLDFQSMGATGVNHFVNRLMLLMFPSGRPLFRASIQPAALEKLQIPSAAAQRYLADVELRASKLFETLNVRPALFRVLRQAAITGNGLLHFEKRHIRSRNIRDFVVSRCLDGSLHTLVMQDRVIRDELPDDLKKYCGYGSTRENEIHTCVKRVGKTYVETMSVNGNLVGTKEDTDVMQKVYSSYDKCPYKVIPWDLEDYADYATGAVEHCYRDLLALHYLSQALVEGAQVSAETRYLVASTAGTLVEDLAKSRNGDFIPGSPGDIGTLNGGNPQALAIVREAIADYTQRIGRAFLMNSAATRQAERVTAVEIRANSQELETSYGALTAGLGISLQRPVAMWLLDALDIPLNGAKVDINVLTGSDALGRGVEMENFNAAVSYMAALNNLPPAMVERIKVGSIAEFIGQGTQTEMSRFFLTDEEAQAQQAQAQQQDVNQQAAVSAVQQQ